MVMRTTIEISPLSSVQLWEEQQRAVRMQKSREHREWLRNFALGSGLIVVTVAVAMTLAR
jgi:hypothetical protein